MSKAKIELWALLFVLSGWSMPEGASMVVWVLFALGVAIWLGRLFQRAHPDLFRRVQSDLPGTQKVPRPKSE